MSDVLSPAERILAAFEKRKIDRIAIYHSGFSSRVGSALLGHECYSGGGINQWRESKALWEGPDAHAAFVEQTTQDARDLARVSKSDMIRLAYWRLPTKPTRKIDEYTYLFGDPDGVYKVQQLDPVTELYQVIDSCDPSAPQTVEDLEPIVAARERALENYHPTAAGFKSLMESYDHFAPEYAVPAGGYGLSVPNRELVWLEAIAVRPDLVERYLECQCVVACRYIEAMGELPIRYCMGGGDFCGNNGPNYSPQFFHEAMLPRLKRMSDTAHKHGKFTTFASDGDLWPVADDLFGASGTDAFHEIDRIAGMDHRKLRERYPNLTCFGNISTITLHLGSKEDVIAEARDNAEAALELGGIICGVSNQVPPLVPIENVIAMFETLAEYH